jgi:hypothetical protein
MARSKRKDAQRLSDPQVDRGLRDLADLVSRRPTLCPLSVYRTGPM